MASSSQQPRVVSVQVDFGGAPATFDLPKEDDIRAVWHALQSLYPTLPQSGASNSPTHRLTYLDTDGDEVELESSEDLSEARQQALQRGMPAILELFVRPSNSHASSANPKLARSSMLGEDGAWETISEDGEIAPPPQANLRSQSNASVEEAAPHEPVAAESPEPLVEEPDASKAQPLTIEEFKGQPAEVSAPNVAPEQKSAAVTNADSSPAAASPSSWSLFGIFGRSAPANTPAAVDANIPVAEPVASQTPMTNTELDSQSASACFSSADSSQLSLKQQAERDFEMPADDDHDIQAELDAAGRNMQQNMWDSADVAHDVLSRVFTSMLARTEEQLGLDSSAASPPPAGAFVRPPHQALLAQLKGLDARAFDGIVNEFVRICTQHVEHTAAEAKRIEEDKIAALARELAEKAAMEEARAREEQRLREEEQARFAAEKERELAEQRRLEEEQYRRLAAEEAARQAAAAAESARLEAERAAKLAAARAMEEAIRAKEEALRRAQVEAAAQIARLQAEKASAEREAEEAARAHQNLEAQVSPRAAAAVSIVPQQAQDAVVIVDQPAPLPIASPVAPAQLSAAEKFNRAMAELRDMGFTDERMNTYWLQKTNVDIPQTIDWLMADAASEGDLKQSIAQSLGR